MAFQEKRWRPTKFEWLWAAVFLGVFCPYFAWRWNYYGWPFPNTYYVKSGAPNFWTPGFAYFRNWVTDNRIWMVPVLATLGTKRIQQGGLRLLTLGGLICIVISFHVIKVGGDYGAPSILCAHHAHPGGHGCPWTKSTDMLRRISHPIWGCGHSHSLVLVQGHIKLIQDHALSVGSDNGVDRIGWLKQFHEQCTRDRTAPSRYGSECVHRHHRGRYYSVLFPTLHRRHLGAE